MGLGLFQAYKDSIVAPQSFEEYEKKMKNLMQCYMNVKTTYYDFGHTDTYSFDMDQENLIVLVSLLDRLLTEKQYDNKCLEEVKNPNLFIPKLRTYWNNYRKDAKSFFNDDKHLISYGVSNYYKYVADIKFRNTFGHKKDIDLEGMYNELCKLWQYL